MAGLSCEDLLATIEFSPVIAADDAKNSAIFALNRLSVAPERKTIRKERKKSLCLYFACHSIDTNLIQVVDHLLEYIFLEYCSEN